MSSPDLRRSQEPPDGSRKTGRRKSILFCPDCGHESFVGGDWTASDDYVTRTRQLRCPECSATIADRPLPSDSAARDTASDDAPTAGPVGRTVETVARLWHHSVRHWLQWSRRVDA